MSKYLIGIDIGGTTVKIGKFLEDGSIVTSYEIPTDTSDRGKNILFDIYKSLIDRGENLKEIIGYGFGVPGPVMNNQVTQCVNLGWEEYDVRELFGKMVSNMNVFVNNDANVAALGELFGGAAKGKKDVVMMTLGTGLGGGVISNYTPVEGHHGAGGELGHVVVNLNGRLCNCGNKGCLETIASATGIVREYQELREDLNIPSILDGKEISARAIMDAAKEKDQLAENVINNVAFYLGYACHIISVTTNPSTILIGGGVSKAGNFLLDKVINEFSKYQFDAVKNTEIKLATLGNDAGMYGAALLVKNG